jgi:hypothetical protein
MRTLRDLSQVRDHDIARGALREAEFRDGLGWSYALLALLLMGSKK